MRTMSSPRLLCSCLTALLFVSCSALAADGAWAGPVSEGQHPRHVSSFLAIDSDSLRTAGIAKGVDADFFLEGAGVLMAVPPITRGDEGTPHAAVVPSAVLARRAWPGEKHIVFPKSRTPPETLGETLSAGVGWITNEANRQDFSKIEVGFFDLDRTFFPTDKSGHKETDPKSPFYLAEFQKNLNAERYLEKSLGVKIFPSTGNNLMLVAGKFSRYDWSKGEYKTIRDMEMKGVGLGGEITTQLNADRSVKYKPGSFLNGALIYGVAGNKIRERKIRPQIVARMMQCWQDPWAAEMETIPKLEGYSDEFGEGVEWTRESFGKFRRENLGLGAFTATDLYVVDGEEWNFDISFRWAYTGFTGVGRYAMKPKPKEPSSDDEDSPRPRRCWASSDLHVLAGRGPPSSVDEDSRPRRCWASSDVLAGRGPPSSVDESDRPRRCWASSDVLAGRGPPTTEDDHDEDDRMEPCASDDHDEDDGGASDDHNKNNNFALEANELPFYDTKQTTEDAAREKMRAAGPLNPAKIPTPEESVERV